MKNKNEELFPLIKDLPEHLSAEEWTWTSAQELKNCFFQVGSDWWIGTDKELRSWLVKLTGTNYAYREHVFASLAQKLEISCQSSVYITIPHGATPMLKRTDRQHLGLWLFLEHQNICSTTPCPLQTISNLDFKSDESITMYVDSGIAHAQDWIRGEVLGYLCGQHEPPGHLFTSGHEFVQIDNELMFASDPVPLEDCYWLKFPTGRRLAAEVCHRLSEVSEGELSALTKIPINYPIIDDNEIPRRVREAKYAATDFLKLSRF